MRTKEEFTKLFEKIGVTEPEQWAEAEVKENLGNLPKAAFLRQAWEEIPKTNDTLWLETWMKYAKKKSCEAHIVQAYENLLSLGAPKSDIVNICRGVMSQFLYRIAYLLDDPSIQDEELKDAVRWGLYEESEDDEPVERLGCIHEIVFSVDPEYKGG